MKAHSRSRRTALIFHNLGAVLGWVVNAMPGSLYHGKRAPVSIVREDGWVPQPVWSRENLLPPRGLNPEPSSCLASRYTDYAVPAPDKELEIQQRSAERVTKVWDPVCRHNTDHIVTHRVSQVHASFRVVQFRISEKYAYIQVSVLKFFIS